MKVKKVLISAVAIALAVVMLCGSAFAFNLTYQKVSLPDPYGIMPLSLDDDRGYTLFTSAPITYGPYTPSSERKSYASQSKNSPLNGSQLAYFTTGSSMRGAYISVPSGFYADVSASVSIDNSVYGSVIFGGNALLTFKTFFFAPGASVATSINILPSYAQVLVNGLPVGDIVSISNGTFTFPDIEVDLTSSVTTLGIRFTYGINLSNTLTTGTNGDYSQFLNVTFTDGFSYTPVEGEDPYIPFFERIVAWLTSIATSVSPLNSTLLRIEDLLGGMNDPDSALGRLANIFARDDDIQLRDDMDDTLKEATSVFYDDTENPSTAISTDTISQAGETLQGVSSMFDSGYSATDAFQEISDQKDDFMQWFTAETASWLDSVPATYSREDDPYNMWMIENQYSEMAKKRGEDN